MDGMDPEDFLIYEEFFEDENQKINKNGSICGIAAVLLILSILLVI